MPLPLHAPSQPNTASYATFEEAKAQWGDTDYGVHEVRHRPGHTTGKEYVTESDKRRSKATPLTGQNVRLTYQCNACGKYRCIFAPKRLGETVATEVRIAIETGLYCGDRFFPTGHHLHDEVFVKEGITCNAPIQTAFYAALDKTARNTEFPWPCCYCGDVIGSAADAALSTLLRPVCTICESSGLKSTTKAARNSLPKFFKDIAADIHGDDHEAADKAPPAEGGAGEPEAVEPAAPAPTTGYRIFMAEERRKIEYPVWKDRAAAWSGMPDDQKAPYLAEGDRNRSNLKAAKKRELPKDLAEAAKEGSKKHKALAAAKPCAKPADDPAAQAAKVVLKPPAFFENHSRTTCASATTKFGSTSMARMAPNLLGTTSSQGKGFQ